MSDLNEKGPWRCSINYGPDGEANYAFVYDANGDLVSNFKTHHAVAIVDAMNGAAAPADVAGLVERLQGLRALVLPAPPSIIDETATALAAMAAENERLRAAAVQWAGSAGREAAALATRAEAADTIDALVKALEPFAKCADELDGSEDVPSAPDGEWARFRLLTDDYRLARAALAMAKKEGR